MIFWGGLVVAWRRGGVFCKALGARLPGGGIVCSRLTASRSHRKVTVCTPRRRGVPFTRVRRRGLRSMSGRYPYGIGNPPTLRRSSFPRRDARPAGERRAHRSGEGCPKQSIGSARLKRRLRPTRRSKSATPAVAVQIMPLRKPAPTISNHKNPARSFFGPGR